MDDIQFWVYVVFAVIWVVARALRKKSRETTKSRPKSPLETEDSQEAPVSFEELLEEITGRKSLKEEQKPIETYQEDVGHNSGPYGEEEDRAEESIKSEGSKRHFADDESRRVYEESIKRAEQQEEFEPAEGYQSIKLVSRKEEEEESSGFSKEIAEMFSDTDGARKAVILGEILNRKY